jgi:hypothetical protein
MSNVLGTTTNIGNLLLGERTWIAPVVAGKPLIKMAYYIKIQPSKVLVLKVIVHSPSVLALPIKRNSIAS